MHVLDKFRYCPVCGSAEFEPSTVKSKRCRHCGFEYFLNPSAANAALIMNGRDELLVITRKNDPAKGTLDLPGGFYDMNETAEQGLAREVKEETGLTVVSSRLLFSYSNTYLYSGLPAGPICNPGLASIQAALNPESTSYYYYALDTATGTHQFFSDYASHQAFVSTQNYG